MRRRPLLVRRFATALIIAIALVDSMLAASPASATPWLNGPYLYRYVFWGLRSEFSRSEAYKMFPCRKIETAPPLYEFPHATRGTLPAEVEYKDGDSTKLVALDKLLESSGIHAFIVLKDGKLLEERYLNGYQRDSICVSRSVAKSFTSALVGIAIDEGFIKSVNEAAAVVASAGVHSLPRAGLRQPLLGGHHSAFLRELLAQGRYDWHKDKIPEFLGLQTERSGYKSSIARIPMSTVGTIATMAPAKEPSHSDIPTSSGMTAEESVGKRAEWSPPSFGP